MKNVILLLISTFFLFSYAGEKPTGPSGTLSEPLANDFIKKGFHHVVLSSGERAFTAPELEVAGCMPASYDSDGYIDLDMDKVPPTLKATYNCAYSSEGVSYKVIGSMSLEDKDNLVPLPRGGFRMIVNDFVIERSSAEFNSLTRMNDFFDATVKGRKVAIREHFRTGEFKSAAGYLTDDLAEYWINITGRADDAKNPKASGRMVIDGYVKVEGVAADGGAGGYILKIASQDLTYKDGCSLFYNSGSVTFTDGSNNTLKVAYTDYSRSWIYNGKPISEVSGK